MSSPLSRTPLALSLALVAGIASAQSFVDGVRGAEWAGITPVRVAYSASAPNSNFGAPTNANDVVAYDLYLRTDASYLYALAEAAPAGMGMDNYDAIPGAFANLYFGTNYPMSTGSTLGFEIGAGTVSAFKPGVSGPTDATGFGAVSAVTAPTTYANGGRAAVVEFGLPISYLYNDPQGIGFDKTVPGNDVRLNLSQTFSYSVGGGSGYGSARLGRVTIGQPVPEPASMAALGFGALALLKRRKKAAK